MSEFAEHLVDVMSGFGPVEPRRMFGGHGIFFDGLMIGLVAGDQLYLKVDAESKPEFEARGLPAFEYDKQGKLMKMSYHLAPEEIFDDPDEAMRWTAMAFEAARRANTSKRKKKK